MSAILRLTPLTLLLGLAVLPAAAPPVAGDREPDVIFHPTPVATVEKMLEVARLTENDVLHDLGCGDGRIVLMAARKYKCKAFGFDIDPARIKDCEARKAKEPKEVQDRVTFRKQDILAPSFDVSEATVVTMYLLPDINEKLIPKLKKLAPGSRIVSHAFDMGDVLPDKGFPLTVKAKNDRGEERECEVFLWTTPLKLKKE